MGLLGLFLAAFLAGSIVPFPSEGVLAALVYNGVPMASAVLVGTLGNVLGAVTLYAMGWKLDPETIRRAREKWKRWGAWGLLFAWVPFVGDAFVLAAGLVRVRFWLFLVLVAAGKAARYFAVAWAAS